jgi:hypothetical protein
MLSFRLIAVSIVTLITLTNKTESARNDTAQIDPSISWFLNYTPFFDFAKIPQISKKCRRDFQMFSEAMDNLELWALKSEIFLVFFSEMKINSLLWF